MISWCNKNKSLALLLLVIVAIVAYNVMADNKTYDINEVVIHPMTLINIQEEVSDIDGSGCMYGTISDTMIHITEFDVIDGDQRSCSPFNYLGNFYYHSETDCSLSERELYEFGRSKAPIAGVVCGDRMLFYGPEGYIGDAS